MSSDSSSSSSARLRFAATRSKPDFVQTNPLSDEEDVPDKDDDPNDATYVDPNATDNEDDDTPLPEHTNDGKRLSPVTEQPPAKRACVETTTSTQSLPVPSPAPAPAPAPVPPLPLPALSLHTRRDNTRATIDHLKQQLALALESDKKLTERINKLDGAAAKRREYMATIESEAIKQANALNVIAQCTVSCHQNQDVISKQQALIQQCNDIISVAVARLSYAKRGVTEGTEHHNKSLITTKATVQALGLVTCSRCGPGELRHVFTCGLAYCDACATAYRADPTMLCLGCKKRDNFDD